MEATIADLGAHGLALLIARQAGDDGASRAARHADDESPNWTSVAVEHVRAYARRFDSFVAEDVRWYAEIHGFPPAPTARAWGSVMKRARKEGIITADGYAPAVSSNGGPKTLWRRSQS
jgi:hypothetical protein